MLDVEGLEEVASLVADEAVESVVVEEVESIVEGESVEVEVATFASASFVSSGSGSFSSPRSLTIFKAALR